MNRNLSALITGLAILAFGGWAAAIGLNADSRAASPMDSVVALDLSAEDGTPGLCSGAVIAPDTILTAAHCVTGVSTISVRTRQGDSVSLATVLWVSDAYGDVALLRAPVSGAAIAPLSCANVTTGERVTVIGHPFAHEWSLTAGIISADRGDFIQLDVTVLPGNSGGPVFNEAGEVIGIVSYGTGMGWGVLVGQNFANSPATICSLLAR